MRNFSCTHCGTKVYFKNVQCVKCGHALGFDPDTLAVIALKAEKEPGLYRRVSGDKSDVLRYCNNAVHGACNWLTRNDDPNMFCVACDLNRTIPNLSEPGNLAAWQELERAKKRLVYSLLRFGLTTDTSPAPPGRLIFDFTRNSMTGHLDGVININVMEADAVERERQRQQFDEPYRSLLGHLRHESGHYYWHVLVENAGLFEEFRALFGDERADYNTALHQHHMYGPKPDWQFSHVSGYASMHPFEDWAETWAHYLHMVDSVDTAEAEGMEPRAAGLIFGSIWPFKKYDVYTEETLDSLLERWVPLTLALNSMNRSMGHADYYPFVIPDAAREKLRFVHRLIRAKR
ncbi:MAG: hypothetical protein B7Y80_11860 [Hyphomicrobium sp. 32-62-53]|nr:MAG: hypothetical protein B7Z29_01055 [Hyphomicrobium sp. 12-62-95]OYX99202.1 MAG: hypothetical protein B7Y80_11860 [Hyphomicrobium sp. 32-62-53]